MAGKFSGLRRERAHASAQFRDGTFRNPNGATASLKGNPLPLLGEFVFGGSKRTPRAPLPIERPHPHWTRTPETGLRLTWLGHSSVLVEIDGLRVLTDPVFAERASPRDYFGPKRFHPVPAAVEELPALDAVVLSHNHYDHLCRKTLTSLARTGVPIITALGVGLELEALGWPAARIVELDWWEHHTLQVQGRGELEITATPCQHFSGRALFDRNETLWASWVLRGARHRVFFSGDTGLTDAFTAIAQRLGPFDVVMLEIGAFHEAWADIHLGPKNALTAFDMLGGGTLFPVHWGTFDLGLHPWAEPGTQMLTLAAEQRKRVLMPPPGGVFEPARTERFDPWWIGLR